MLTFISYFQEGHGDGFSHGTSVAATVGGRDVGVAKQANLIAIKVLDSSGSGSMSDIIAGIDWAVGQAQVTGNRSVINMSLSGGLFAPVEVAIDNAVAAGVPIMYVYQRKVLSFAEK